MTWVDLLRFPEGEALRVAWIVRGLQGAGVEVRLNGESFSTPTLEVREPLAQEARTLVVPLVGLPSDDAMWESEPRIWWKSPPRRVEVGVLAGALGLFASTIRKNLSDAVECGIFEDDCPIPRCPVMLGREPACQFGLWSACRPMLRLETFLLPVGSVLRGGAPVQDVTRRHDEVMEELKSRRGWPESALAFCHVLSLRMSEGRLRRLVKLGKRPTSAVVDDVMRETVEAEGKVVPIRFEVAGADVIAADAEEWDQN